MSSQGEQSSPKEPGKQRLPPPTRASGYPSGKGISQHCGACPDHMRKGCSGVKGWQAALQGRVLIEQWAGQCLSADKVFWGTDGFERPGLIGAVDAGGRGSCWLVFHHLPEGMSFLPSNHTPELSWKSDVARDSLPLGDLSRTWLQPHPRSQVPDPISLSESLSCAPAPMLQTSHFPPSPSRFLILRFVRAPQL